MGETEISLSGGQVCRPEFVNTSVKCPPVHIVKKETITAVSSPSPPPSVSPPPTSVTPTPSTSNQQSGFGKTHDCTTCGKSFAKPSKLKNHLRLHTGERPFPCTHTGCDKAYTNSSHLLRHMKSHQGNQSPLEICLECKAMFRSAGGLRKHMKTIHMTENEYPYACKECGRAFRKKKLLSYHMHEHGGDPAFRCEHCQVQFTHMYLYNRHMRGHRTHPCRWPGCQVVLANWSLFRKHMALHNREEFSDDMPMDQEAIKTDSGEVTGEVVKHLPTKPIIGLGRKCPICGIIIRSRSRYYTHVEQHKEILRCPHPSCERVYAYKRNLDNHIRTHHTENARFVCEICDRSLASKQKLKMHKISMHGPNGPKPHIRRNIAKTRKDAGTRKRALAAKLAGIEIPYEEEKRLLLKDEEFRKGDPLCVSSVISSPESGFSSIPEALKSNLSWYSDVALSSGTEEGYRTGDPSDASDLQGPSETQRRNEDHQESSSDEEFMYSGGDSSDEESGSGHCEEDEDDEGEGDGDGDEDHDDDEGGDDDDDDDFNDDEDEDDDDEGEENNGNEEGGEEELESDNQLAQGEGGNGKRPGSSSLSRDEIQDGSGDFGVDRDSTIPSIESNGSPAESPVPCPEDDDNETVENQRKRKAEESQEASKRQRTEHEAAESTGRPDLAVAQECLLPDAKQLSRNVDPSVFEVKITKEKASKGLPEEVWVSTFQSSIDHLLPVRSGPNPLAGFVKRENDS